jgi:diphthine-ammonia ligase
MLALYRILCTKSHEVKCLINMCDVDGEHSRSHGLEKQHIKYQADMLGIAIHQPQSDFKQYETHFKAAIELLKKQGVAGGVFGDIYLQPHRDWIERVCAETGIIPFFPLWGNSTTDLLNEFVGAGFKTMVVSVNSKMLDKSWLGRLIDKSFINDISKLAGIDPCAENGEYHSFVFDGSIFKTPLYIKTDGEYFKDDHWFLNLKMKQIENETI